MTYPIKSPKKLIEVALPLDAINAAASREKSIRHGHPSTLHLWWARRPLAAARAVIFAQLVNDPGYQQGGGFKYGKNKKEAAIERQRLFRIIEELVKWENTTNEEVLDAARAEIRRSWQEVCELNKDHPEAAELFNPEKMPGLHDPFAGGGSIPLEAQRLGLEAYASDLNPVAVLINKAMIEIPPKFAGRAPINPESRRSLGMATWKGAEGLAEDVRHYGQWMRDEAEKSLGRYYRPIEITEAMTLDRPELCPLIGKKVTVIAWLWARSVASPNPAFSHVHVPLASTFTVCSKKGRETWIQPETQGDQFHFTVKLGPPPTSAKLGTKASGRGAEFRCLVSGVPISGEYIKSEAQAGRMGAVLLAVVVEGSKGRVYLSPEAAFASAEPPPVPEWKPDVAFFQQALGFRVGLYGMTRWSDIFTARQLTTLSMFCRLVEEARERVADDFRNHAVLTNEDARRASEYANAIATYLALGVGRLANRSATLNFWDSDGENIQQVFARQVLPIVWDFVEGNPFSSSTGNFTGQLDYLVSAVAPLPAAQKNGTACQRSAVNQEISKLKFISTDPPYYDNVGYADLSDFFYVWLRRALRSVYPELLATLAVPKDEELVATPARHGGKKQAEAFFLAGMTEALRRLAEQAHGASPVTIFYAFRQSETDDSKGTSNTGWETFLDAVLRAGFAITGTWPIRTEYTGNLKTKRNALASSIVLVCRRRSNEAPSVSRRDFTRELNASLPEALDEMTKGLGEGRSPVAPVDLSQAIIGPGIGIFSKYSAVLEADGSPMSIKTALQLINRFLAEDDFDHDTQFCLHWFDQYGWGEGAYGEADVLARAKATSVSGLVEAGVAVGGGGKVRLLRPNDYPSDWDPRTDTRLPVWEALHQLIRTLRSEGETGAGQILAAIRPMTESIRQLAYRLYTLCERRGWADDARAYNELVTSWTAVEFASNTVPEALGQLKLFGGES